jgi:hypothetical protein
MQVLPVRDDSFLYNAHLAVVPQPIVLNRAIARKLEDYAHRMFAHFPIENSLARREYGVPMLLGRFDVIVTKAGDIQICELDDVCSLWPAMAHLNPIANSYLHALEAQLAMPIYTAELFQYRDWPLDVSPRVRKKYCHIWHFNDTGSIEESYIPRSSEFPMATLRENGLHFRTSQRETDRSSAYYETLLKQRYLHNEDHWRGDINDAWLLQNKRIELNKVALSVRAFRNAPGFKKHMDRYGHRSISMAWHRDSKLSLVQENLAVLATNLEVALAFARRWQADFPEQLLVFKTLYGARTEGTAIFSSKGTKLRGTSSATQIARKFKDAAREPIVIQPYTEPDTLATAGVTFYGEENSINPQADRSIIRSVKHIGSDMPGQRVVAGQEHHFRLLFRSFVVYLPKERRLVHAGGMWQATDGRLIHGGSHSVAGPLYLEGLPSHGSTIPQPAVSAAERLWNGAESNHQHY